MEDDGDDIELTIEKSANYVWFFSSEDDSHNEDEGKGNFSSQLAGLFVVERDMAVSTEHIVWHNVQIAVNVRSPLSPVRKLVNPQAQQVDPAAGYEPLDRGKFPSWKTCQ